MLLYLWEYPSPVGNLCLGVTEQAAAYIGFSPPESRWQKRWFPGNAGDAGEKHREMQRRLCLCLDAYFAGGLRQFDIPLDLRCTEYQKQVYEALRRIPYGTTVSYAGLARQIGSGARAVGQANHRNPVSIIVPCHRVIGAHGNLVGYGGGIERKRQLLALEGIVL